MNLKKIMKSYEKYFANNPWHCRTKIEFSEWKWKFSFNYTFITALIRKTHLKIADVIAINIVKNF